MNDYKTLVDMDCRLVLLRALAEEHDTTLNESVLQNTAALFGHNRSKDYFRQQLRFLEDVGAVTLTETQGVMIATLTAGGLDHVERRSAIEGVSRPSPSPAGG